MPIIPSAIGWLNVHMNRMLKTALRKHTTQLGVQWDKTCLGFCEPIERLHMHESTGEEPSFLLFGMDCKTPTWSCSAATNTTNANWSGGSRGGHPVPVFSTEAGRKSNTKSTEANQEEISSWGLGHGELPTWTDSEARQAVLALAQTTLSGILWESWCHCGQYLLPARDPNSNTYV